MIERLIGTVIAASDKTITVLTAHGVGYAVVVAEPTSWKHGVECTVYTTSHWNADKGPTLYGFANELARHVFLLVITVSKIGPAIALALLRSSTPARIVQDISTGHEKGLSGCTGVGPKKAQHIVHALQDKVGALIAQHDSLASSSAADWQHVQDALASLNYSRQEINDAVSYLTQQHAQSDDMPELHVLLRQALAFLSSPR